MVLDDGLRAVAKQWPALERGYTWVDKAAELLRTDAEHSAPVLRARYLRLLRSMTSASEKRGRYQAAPTHFLKVTRSYLPGLFHCYAVPGLPRTNNDLEHVFGSARYHERRASDRRRGSEGLVVRGRVRLVAAVGTRANPGIERYIGRSDREAWRKLRSSLSCRQHARILGRRFRNNPDAYLRDIEAMLIKPPLPA